MYRALPKAGEMGKKAVDEGYPRVKPCVRGRLKVRTWLLSDTCMTDRTTLTHVSMWVWVSSHLHDTPDAGVAVARDVRCKHISDEPRMAPDVSGCFIAMYGSGDPSLIQGVTRAPCTRTAESIQMPRHSHLSSRWAMSNPQLGHGLPPATACVISQPWSLTARCMADPPTTAFCRPGGSDGLI